MCLKAPKPTLSLKAPHPPNNPTAETPITNAEQKNFYNKINKCYHRNTNP